METVNTAKTVTKAEHLTKMSFNLEIAEELQHVTNKYIHLSKLLKKKKKLITATISKKNKIYNEIAKIAKLIKHYEIQIYEITHTTKYKIYNLDDQNHKHWIATEKQIQLYIQENKHKIKNFCETDSISVNIHKLGLSIDEI